MNAYGTHSRRAREKYAAVVGPRSAVIYAILEPRPACRPSPPPPDEREAGLPLAKAPARPAARAPEEVAKAVTGKRPSPVGQPTKVEIFLRLVLPRPVLERLTAQTIREGRNIEGVVAEILAASK